jgi:hypothetical protein
LRWQTISIRTLLGYLKKRTQMTIWACKSTSKVKQKSHVNASSTSSAPFTPNSVSLGEDSEPLIYQDRPIG